MSLAARLATPMHGAYRDSTETRLARHSELVAELDAIGADAERASRLLGQYDAIDREIQLLRREIKTRQRASAGRSRLLRAHGRLFALAMVVFAGFAAAVWHASSQPSIHPHERVVHGL